jgi:hypothetical protein
MAAARNSTVQSGRALARVVAYSIAVLALTVLAMPATALDDIAVGGGAGAAASTSACPELTRVKYPWASCEPNEWGGVSLRAAGQPAPLECRLRLPNGKCAAAPEPWAGSYQGLVPGY